MAGNRIGKPFFIYALVCPLTLEVKYVGQTTDIEQRTRGGAHRGGAHGGTGYNGPLTQWLMTLGHLRPYRVILEQGLNRRLDLPATAPNGDRGRRPIGMRSTWLSSCLETKWIKRFHRTIINKNKVGVIEVNKALINPPLPWEDK